MIINILHIIVAFNVLLSSFGLFINEHICKMKGTSISYYFKGKTCCSSKKRICHFSHKIAKIKEKSGGHQFSKSPCCQDKSHFEKINLQGTHLGSKSIWKNLQFEKHLYPLTKWILEFNSSVSKNLSQYFYKSPPHCLKLYRLIQVIRC